MIHPFAVLRLLVPRRSAAGILIAATVFNVAVTARAHGDLDQQIQAVSLQLDQSPSADLFLLRAELHYEHENFAAALADYDDAGKLNPRLDAVSFGRARTLFKAGELALARDLLDVYLEQKPDHADGFLLRARVLVALKEYAAAVRDFDRSLALAPAPLPESFLERADALVALGDRPAALRGLDEGISRLGNLVTLQSAAIALERDLNHYDAALARVDRVLTTLRRKETWLARRGEILSAAGRKDEALRTYQEALSVLEQLPAQHRNVKPMQDLEKRLHQLLGT
ncbi:MAG: tetratricopeptide repeat protein [Opitutus sp.]